MGSRPHPLPGLLLANLNSSNKGSLLECLLLSSNKDRGLPLEYLLLSKVNKCKDRGSPLA